MKLGILAGKRQKAINSIAFKLGIELAVKGKTNIRELRNLEAIEKSIDNSSSGSSGISLEEVLSIDGLSKGSIKKITDHYGNT